MNSDVQDMIDKVTREMNSRVAKKKPSIKKPVTPYQKKN